MSLFCIIQFWIIGVTDPLPVNGSSRLIQVNLYANIFLGTCFGGIYSRADTPTVSYVQLYHIPNTLLRINYLFDILVSTMAPSGFGPYCSLWLQHTQTKCIGVIPTPWAMMRVLGLVSFPPQQDYVDANALNHLSVARLKHWVLR